MRGWLALGAALFAFVALGLALVGAARRSREPVGWTWMIRSLRRLFQRTRKWQPFPLGMTRGAMPSWGKEGGWEIQPSVNGDVRLWLTERGTRRFYALQPYEALMLGNQLRDHALSVGGLPYMSEADHVRREELYQNQEGQKFRVWP